MITKRQFREKPLSHVEQACITIRGFKNLYKKFDDKIRLAGQSESALSNYARKLAQLSLHFGKLPHRISEKKINRYLASLSRNSKTPSLSDFKFTVYGLRYCYRLMGMKRKAVRLPVIRSVKKLPVVLNYKECRAILKAPALLKHRILLSLIYSAGLRLSEARNLRIADVDMVRMMIHIRQSKNLKDRYVPLSPMLIKGLRKYINTCNPVDFLFNGNKPGKRSSDQALQAALKNAVRKCKIQKRISLHSLRHSYATHLLEYGMNIVSIKNLLGHEHLETTLVYLHVVKQNFSKLFSPLDKLYKKRSTFVKYLN
jgi:integrase/recombinase XerD